MAKVSSHILDSVGGGHAAGIRCQLFARDGKGASQLVFDILANAEGRIDETIALDDFDGGGEFELVLHGAEYFAARGIDAGTTVSAVVIRFVMVDDARRYHMPVMLAPHSYSTWWSG